MNSFEQLIKGMLEEEGYWVRSSYKAELTAGEKLKIGRPTSPRREIDLLAYRDDTKQVLVIECTSYLDSAGVSYQIDRPRFSLSGEVRDGAPQSLSCPLKRWRHT